MLEDLCERIYFEGSKSYILSSIICWSTEMKSSLQLMSDLIVK